MDNYIKNNNENRKKKIIISDENIKILKQYIFRIKLIKRNN